MERSFAACDTLTAGDGARKSLNVGLAFCVPYAWYMAADAPKAAGKVIATLSATDARAAEALGREYRGKYGEKRPASDGA
jgi:hypothetical protein